MQLNKPMKVLGIDVCKASIVTAILEQYPAGGVATFWKKSNRNKDFYPSFHSCTTGKKKLKSVWDFIEYLEQEKPDIAVIEPTGLYSRLWREILKHCGIEIKLIGHIELKRYRHKIAPSGHAKNDSLDALCMAAYPFDPENQLEHGGLNPDKFLRLIPSEVERLRDLVLQLEFLTAARTRFTNYTRQRLSFEFPERASIKISNRAYQGVPPLWLYLAGRHDEMTQRGSSRLSKSYQVSIAQTLGLEIDPITRFNAGCISDIINFEKSVEFELEGILSLPQFKSYMRVFKSLRFGLRIQSVLLAYIFPFESFLLNGKPFKSHEFREVKKRVKEKVNGKVIVKFEPGQMKRIRRDFSRDAFSMFLGSGSVCEFSGDSWVEISAGHELPRVTLWRYVYSSLLTFKQEISPLSDFGGLINYRDKLNGQAVDGRHIQRKLMAATLNCVYRLLVKEFEA